MLPSIVKITTLPSYILHLQFDNGEFKEVDMKPYLHYPAFQPLKDKDLFMQAKAMPAFVYWNEDIDISSATLYIDGTTILPA
ncbi:MAG: DUF2442 domain-containing protein [Chitinophagia bacterium]|nr:DUF2442 domain-containing protein [Chitinophagia bacterium]